MPLPILSVLPELERAVAGANRVVLQAPPGAGKSTGVPPALLHADWLEQRRIIMLEPRRLAARAVARRTAWMLGEDVGGTVGYRMRGDSRVSARTRIEVVTEGVLTRMLLRDPTLDGYGIVIFDEFHERSIHADFGLALSLQAQELLRPDLRILVMSATIDGAAVAAVLGDAPLVSSAGRAFSVDVRYVPRRRELGVEAAVAAAVERALASDPGSILAFLPGAAEIRRTEHMLADRTLPADVRITPLYGDLGADAQDAAVRPAPPGERKVVLATNIAETSLTIEGVRVVVDAGLARVARFSPRTGMARLETTRVSRAAATQRAGRAGRESPGVCYRLWDETEQAALLERARPEILDADLASLALDLAAAGVTDVHALHWLDAPPAPSLARARELLTELGALDDAHRITAHGKGMARLGLHPRLAHMLVRAHERGFGATACVVAALLEERDLLRGPGEREPDLHLRFELVASRAGNVSHTVRARAAAMRSLLRLQASDVPDAAHLGDAVALAYPERVGFMRATPGRYLLRNGTGAVLPGHGALWREEFLAIADLDGRSPNATIYLAASVSRQSVQELFAGDIEIVDVIEWDAAAGAVNSVRQERLGAIVLHEGRLANPDSEQVTRVMLNAIREQSGVALPFTDVAAQLQDRVAFLRRRDPRWPDWSTAALMASLDEWLAPHIAGARRRADIERLPLGEILLATLSWEERRSLDRLAPTHATVPTGSRIVVDYSDHTAPRIAVRLQELFGLETSPTVADGAVPLTIELLSPAHRPVQVTTDLAGFWRNSYFDVRKDLRGRYPRHAWPEDPLSATPTRRAKPRK